MYSVSYGSQAKVASSVLLDTSSTSNAVLFEIGGVSGVNVTYLTAQVKTTFSSTGNTVITVYYRPTPGSTSGQTLLGTMTIPTASADPSYFICAISDNFCPAGGEIAFTVTTAATSAGTVYVGFEGGLAPSTTSSVPNAILITA